MGVYGFWWYFLPAIYHCRIIYTFSLISREFSTSVGQVWGRFVHAATKVIVIISYICATFVAFFLAIWCNICYSIIKEREISQTKRRTRI
jgi:hypothetical protein